MTVANLSSGCQKGIDYELNKQPFDLSTFGPIRLVVIQPTSFCNLNCDYCYLPDRQSKNRLSLDLIEPIFKTIFTSQFLKQDFSVCWHAGEPLAVPISFYEEVFERIRLADEQYNPHPCEIRQTVQTNGTLINQAWCDLFKQHSVHVGVSLDGPAFLHDAHRKTRKGLGTHASTMRGIAYLQQNGIDFSVITVLTQDSLNYADEIFQFFMDNGITDVGFNMEETEGVHRHSSLNQTAIEAPYRAFIQRFWQRVVQSKGVFKLREFEEICSIVYQGDRMTSTEMNRPFAIVNIDHQGNFSTFDPELLSIKTDAYGDFVLGNVLHDTFESICQTEKFQRMYEDISVGMELCRQNCQYFGVCGGGAGSNKYWENGTFRSSETNACKNRIKIITDVVLDALEEAFSN
jgi:uncharacterized protein